MAVTRAKLTNTIVDVEFDVLTGESVSNSSTVTDKTVEDGSIISDHIQINPLITSINGIMTKNAWDNLQRLRGFYNKKEILKYIGRNGINNVVIESFETGHPRENQGGFDFSITLKQIKLTQTQIVSIVPPRYVAIPESNDVTGNSSGEGELNGGSKNSKAGSKSRTKATTNEGTEQKQEANVDSGTTETVESKIKLSPQLQKVDNYLRERGY